MSEHSEQVWQNLHNSLERTASERDALRARVAALEESETSALYLLARIREALGDNGTRMQDELLDYCRELRDSAGALAALGEDYDALKAERDRYRAALDQIRLEDLSAFDCKLVAAKAQGLIL